MKDFSFVRYCILKTRRGSNSSAAAQLYAHGQSGDYFQRVTRHKMLCLAKEISVVMFITSISRADFTLFSAPQVDPNFLATNPPVTSPATTFFFEL